MVSLIGKYLACYGYMRLVINTALEYCYLHKNQKSSQESLHSLFSVCVFISDVYWLIIAT